jgi:drug/metabolite transporter (DMT)-like permease
VTIALALLSSALFGVGVALQQRPAAEVSTRWAARPGLLIRLVRRPLWLLGMAAELAGFGVQIAALRHGSLVVVQPVITTSLLFTIGLASAWSGGVVSRREWLGVLSVVIGLAVFLALAAPSDHSLGQASRNAWLITGGCIGLSVGVALAVGLRSGGRRRAALLGIAAGLGDAIMAVMTKAFAHSLNSGTAAAVRSWAPYALCAAGLVALLLSQTAYQAGRPTVSLPLITVTDPIVSCAIGIGLFGETIDLDGLRGPCVVVAIIVMLFGLVTLSRSRTVLDVEVGSARIESAPVGSR